MKNNNLTGAKLRMLSSVTLFGTIGLFVRSIPLPSSATALVRGAVGALILLVFALLSGRKLSAEAMRKNAALLCVSGAMIGVNWILLFEAYRYTTVASATICYYLAPVLVILAAPFTLGEKLTGKKLLCVLLALAGTALLSGGAQGGSVRGILCGVGAAAFYASVVTLNKKLKGISAYERTVVQLAAAAVTLAPYVLLTEDIGAFRLTTGQLALLAVVAVVHTGIAYAVYFGAMSELPTQTVALYSYVDPTVAVLLSALVLREPFGLREAVGALCVLLPTFWSELSGE